MKVETGTDAVRELARRARALAIGRTIGEAVPETLEALAAQRDAARARAERLEKGLESALLEIRDAGPKALKYAEQELVAALATQEGGDGE